MIDSVRNAAASVVDALGRALAPPLPPVVVSSAEMLVWGSSEYSPEHAGSSIAGYPWARVGVDAIATNLSQVPIVCTDPVSGVRVDSHWMLDLLRRPDPSMGGKRWRRQMVADFKTSGQMIAIITRDARGRPIRLRRRHPEGWTIEVNRIGDVIAWRDGEGRTYAPSDVFHVGDISWRNDPALAHLGESPIRPLDLGIRAAIAARSQAGKAAKRGRLELMVSAASPMGPSAAEDISSRIEDVRRRGSGTLVTSHDLSVQPLSLSPRDTEWAELDLRTRDETLAVLGVPPVRAQLPSANYGAAKQEMRQYWENLKALADLIDEELTELAGGEVVVSHSFEAIEALQTSYTERLSRVQQWVELGATPYEAARAEGFSNPPLYPDTQPRSDRQNIPPNPALQVDTPQARSLQDRISDVLAEAAQWMQDAVDAGIVDSAVTRHALAERLRSGALAPVADLVADELADATAHAMHTTGQPISCASLPAYGPEHAEILAGQLGDK